MAVPDVQRLMLPLLRIAGDGHEHMHAETLEALASIFHLSDEDRKESLSGGRQTRFDNRVRWARVYLGKALLLESTGRGRFRITERGVDVLKSPPPEITSKFLRRYSEFLELQKGTRSDANGDETDQENDRSPEEALRSIHRELRDNLAQEILNAITKSPASFFEQLVVDLLVKIGYGGSREDAGQAVGRSGDGGVDGIIKEDRLGLDVMYIQAKRWDGKVGRPQVQAFSGSLDGFGAKKGVMITTSRFSADAKHYVDRLGEKKIVLIDGESLADLMIEYGIGVSETALYSVKKLDQDYFPID